MCQTSARKRDTTSGYCDNLRIHALRDLVGTDFVVLSLCDPGQLLGLARHCFELRYQKGISLVPIRQRGFSGPVANVYIDFGQRMLDGYLLQEFASPGAILQSCPDDCLPMCSVWLGHSPGVWQVVTQSPLLSRCCAQVVTAMENPLFRATLNVGFENFGFEMWEKINDHYLFCHPRYGFIVRGSPTCLGYYVNDGFQRAYCYLWFDSGERCVYVCLRGLAKAQLLTNYGTEGVLDAVASQGLASGH